MTEKHPPDEKKSDDALKNLFCASCGRQVLLAEMTDGSARQFAGKIYCSSCLNANKRIGAMKCRKCGAYERPVYDGKTLLCRKCGTELSTRSGQTSGRAGTRKTALKVCPHCNGIVGVAATACGHCGEPLTRAARKAHRRRASAGPFIAGSLVTGLIVLTVIIVGAYTCKIGPWATQPEDTTNDDVAKKIEAIEARVLLAERNISGLKPPVDFEQLALTDDVNKKFESLRKMVQSKPDIDPARVAAVERKLAAIEKTLNELKKAGPPAAMTPENGADKAMGAVQDLVDEPDDEPDEPRNDDQDNTKNKRERMDRAFETLRNKANSLAQTFQFGKALDVWDSRPEFRDPVWQARREKQKQIIRDSASVKFEDVKERAQNLVARGRTTDAIALYQKAAGYGIPEITRAANERIKDLRTGGAPPKPAASGTAKLMQTLTNPKAPQHRRADAAKQLAKLADPAAIPALIKAMDDPDWYVRNVAAQALGRMKAPSAVPKLIENLTHAIIPVRARCVEALKQITGRNFGQNQAEWTEWWKANGDGLMKRPPESKAPSEPQPDIPGAFPSEIVIYTPAQGKIGFTHKSADEIAKGDTAWLYKNGKRLCQIFIQDVGPMHAVGKVKGLQNINSIAKNDDVMIALIK